jgi:hypothetical protein
MYLKIIACEIALREICQVVAHSTHVVDVEFLTQGLHDLAAKGRGEIQARINAVPAEKYDAILVGYGLCGNLIRELKATHTRLVIPRAHDCITFFLGSTERYQRLMEMHPGAYYYTSGWIECLKRRGNQASPSAMQFLPTRAGLSMGTESAYSQWVEQYGEERARYLLEVMGRWTESYTHGILIDFDFCRRLYLHEQVESICERRGWIFEQIEGDLHLLQRWVDGEWDEESFLIVHPGEEVAPSYNERIVLAQPARKEPV